MEEDGEDDDEEIAQEKGEIILGKFPSGQVVAGKRKWRDVLMTAQ